MVVDLRHQDELIRARPLRDGPELSANGGLRSYRGVPQHFPESMRFDRCEAAREFRVRWRERSRPAFSKTEKRLLHGGEEGIRSLVRFRRNRIDAEHRVGTIQLVRGSQPGSGE